jgi:diguanylate cyclase (GGDEF)-like protein
MTKIAPGAATLEREIHLLKATLKNMPVGVFMCDAEGIVQLCNARYLKMYNLDPEVVRPGVSLHEWITHRKRTGQFEGDVDAYCDFIFSTAAGGEGTDTIWETPDGRTIHILMQPIEGEGGWVVTHEDVTKQKKAEAQVAHMAHHDTLTNLPNRTLLQEQLKQALHWVSRGQKLAVLFLDLDNFKGVNDTLGHPVGDELLKTVADRLRACARETDIVARLGGDEFVVVQTPIDGPADSAALAERIRDALTAPCTVMDHHIVIDTSIGIAIAPHDGVEPDVLLKNADMALYGAKAAGRGTARFFEQAMDARMMERRTLEMELRHAFTEGEFELHYQPLVALDSNRINSCEALLRWRHPTRGLVPPATFIPLAEEIGLITRIGEWVIRTACNDAARWPDDVTVAVNVSPVQFRSQNLTQVVTNALAASGLPGTRLCVEITEGILMDQTDAALTTLHQLRALGVKIAMDDFGTGYSSLSYLQKFPFDKIKIDRSFISELSENEEASAIVRAVTSLAASFRMETTAEGVETEEQRDMARDLGCTEMQGWLVSKAQPASEIAKLFPAPRDAKVA